MGFNRQPSSAVIRHAAGAPITRIVTQGEITRIEREQDPFGIAFSCINPAGHLPIGSCGEIVCAHCARIFWS